MSGTGRMLSVRVPESQAEDLEAFAQFDGVALAEEIRRAIAMLLEQRRKDPEFRERVKAALERSQRLLRELGEDEMAQKLDPQMAAEAKEQPRQLARAARRHH